MRIIFMMDNKSKKGGSLKRSKSRPKSGTSEKLKSSQIALSSSLKSSGQPSVNKTVTWRGMETMGYAAVMDTVPGGHKKAETKNYTGILGSGHLPSSDQHTSRQYIQEVKHTFAKRPAVYREFVRILSEVRDPDSDKVEIVKRIIMLFDGYPHLIIGFNFFLPRYIRLEIQDDAVIVKVDEDNDAFGQDSDDEDDDSPTMRYIRNVKWTYQYHPEVYEKFSKVLKDFNAKRIDEVETIHKIVILFQDHPDLILGFNFFLPEGYKVLAHKKHGYVIQHPCQKGMKAHYTPVNVQETYVD